MYKIAPAAPATGRISFHDDNAAKRFSDSVLHAYAGSRYFNPSQPGPVYQYHFYNLPDQGRYSIKYRVDANAAVKDWVAGINYQGDVMAIYKNNKLLYDQFNSPAVNVLLARLECLNDHCFG